MQNKSIAYWSLKDKKSIDGIPPVESIYAVLKKIIVKVRGIIYWEGHRFYNRFLMEVFMWTTVINFIFGIALFINALLFCPQIVKLIKEKNSKDLSVVTFGGFLMIQLSAVCYGYVHRNFILLMGYLLSVIFCSAVVFLILIYRYKTIQK